MPKQVSFNIQTPQGLQTQQMTVPDEGEIFTTTGADLKTLQGGRILDIDPQILYREQGRENETIGNNTQGLFNKFTQEYGIDVNKLPTYNPGFLATAAPNLGLQYGGTYTEKGQSGQGLFNVGKSLSQILNPIQQQRGGQFGSFQSTERSYTPQEASNIFSTPGQMSLPTQQSVIGAPKTATGLSSLSTASTGKIQPPQVPQVPQTQQVQSQQQYGARIPSPADLKFYTENEIVRAPGGAIYLKPGVPIRHSQTQPTAGTIPQNQQLGERIPSPDLLRYYKESELIRQPNGAIYLKPGVPNRHNGAVVGGTPTGQATNAIDDLTKFEIGLQQPQQAAPQVPTLDFTSIAGQDAGAFQGVLNQYQKAVAELQAPIIKTQQQFLNDLSSQPSLTNYFEQVVKDQGLDAAREKINAMQGVQQEISRITKDLPSDVIKRYADIGQDQAQANRRTAIEAVPLARSLEATNDSLQLLQNDYNARLENIDRIMKYEQLNREDKKAIASTALSFLQDNLKLQQDILNKQFEYTTKNIESQIDEQATIRSEQRKALSDITIESLKQGLKGASGAMNDDLVQAVIANPELFNQLTPTEKGKIAPALNELGFSAFGKPLSDSAIKEITQSETAVESLNELKNIITNNSQYVGPLAGLQALNPYSEGRKVQADINRVRQVVGKALEGGVLRKEDEDKYKKILATITDTPETALYKINQLITDVQRNIDTYKNNQLLGGKNVQQNQTGSEDDPLNLFNSDLNNKQSLKGSINKIVEAIGQFESGGNYNAKGPILPSGMYKGQRALGAYQIMEGNIAQWSKEALGKSITPQEFLKSPDLQNKIAKYQMQKIFDKYGTVEDVASVWFSGKPLAQAGFAKDVIGTTVPQYVKNVVSIFKNLA